MRKRIGLIDFDGKIVNLALMKLSSYYKGQGAEVVLNPTSSHGLDKVFCSVLFEKNRGKAEELQQVFPNIEFGGTGWDLTTVLPSEIEALRPDYDLYKTEDIYSRIGGIMTKEKKWEKANTIINAGIGFSSRGCVRTGCGFCVVPKKEGRLQHVANIGDLLNPRSNVLILLDNNLTADKNCIEKLHEIRDRGIVVDITQGVDIRTMTPEIAQALSEVKHLRSIHYAWDLMPSESSILKGIDTLSRYIRKGKHLCFTLVGYNTSFEEDMHRVRTLTSLGVDPYCMIFSKKPVKRGKTAKAMMSFEDLRRHHFSRWVNGRLYKVTDFDRYTNWAKDRDELFGGDSQLSLGLVA